jgi:predicted PurR-regulated permease PerM
MQPAAYLLLFLAAGRSAGELAAVPAALDAAVQSLTAGIATLIVFAVYTQAENHFLNPAVMSRTVRPNPPLGVVSALVAGAIGNWLGGTFGPVGVLLAIPAAVSLHIAVREIWRASSAEQTMPAEPQGDASPDLP